MSDEAAPANEGRPKRSAINGLAATWLARELVARVPEYAAYAQAEGFETLAGHVADAVRPFRLGRRDEAEFARRIEEATMVGAPGRAAIVFAGFDRMHVDAAVLLEGGWIRETARAAPFEGPYSHVTISRAEGRIGKAFAFRHPDLDARGLLMAVSDRDCGCENIPGDLVAWEKVIEATPVAEAHLPGVEARRRQLERGAAHISNQLLAKERDDARGFAEAEFRELAPVDRTTMLANLAGELARTVAEGDGTALRSVFDRLAGVTAAAASIRDDADLISHAPEEPRMDGPRA